MAGPRACIIPFSGREGIAPVIRKEAGWSDITYRKSVSDMMLKLSILNISHSQVAVFDGSLDESFNAWTERHVTQGFVWRPGSVSFATIEEAGPHSVDIKIASPYLQRQHASFRRRSRYQEKRLSRLPAFSQSMRVDLPAGSYALRFEYFVAEADSGPQTRFVFIEMKNPAFKILRADAGLSANPDDFLLTALSA